MGLVGFALLNNNEVDIVKMLTIWTLFNAIFAAIGCILARGHPLAILTAALASPITSLNPALAAGWFAGYVQLRISEPTAEDLQLFLKGTSIGGFWTNRAGRIACYSTYKPRQHAWSMVRSSRIHWWRNHLT